MAAEGKAMKVSGFHIEGVVASTSNDGGKPASAVTEVRIRIWKA
jgi:hypothetical protein